LSLKTKGIKQKLQEKKEWYFVSNSVSRPPLLRTIISCSFLIHFEWFQRLQMRYLKIYKTCLKWKVKKTIGEELKLQNILNTYEKIQSTTPFTLKGCILLSFHYIVTFFSRFGYPSGGLQNFFKFQKEQTMDKTIIMIQYC
jgi:hypothetical protein